MWHQKESFDYLTVNGGASFGWSFRPNFEWGQYRVNNHPYHAPQFIGGHKLGFKT